MVSLHAQQTDNAKIAKVHHSISLSIRFAPTSGKHKN